MGSPQAPGAVGQPGLGHTLLADADVEHAGAGAVAGGHAEAGVGRVHRGVGKHHGGGHEAERGHPGHGSRAVVHQEQGPAGKQSGARPVRLQQR